MTRTIKNILLFPFRFTFAFIAFVRWFFKSYGTVSEQTEDRKKLEAEAAKAMEPYLEKLEQAKNFTFSGAPRNFAPVYHNITGNEIVLPLLPSTNFLEAYENYKKVPSHAHAKEVISFIVTDGKMEVKDIQSWANQVVTFDRPEFERIVENYYNKFYLKPPPELPEELKSKEYKRSANELVLEAVVKKADEDENGLV